MAWDKEAFYETMTEEQNRRQASVALVALTCFWGCVGLALVALLLGVGR